MELQHIRYARMGQVPEELVQDLRYGWRTLLRSPGFAAAALCTLALGIGANTAIFSVVYGMLLRPLPFRDTSRLILLNETTPRLGNVSVSYPNFQDWRGQSRAFSEMAAVSAVHFNMTGGSQPENIGGLAVSPNFLSMAGVRPVMGRGFTADEEKPGAVPVVLLSYALWQSHFGGDRRAIGRTIRLDGETVTIVSSRCWTSRTWSLATSARRRPQPSRMARMARSRRPFNVCASGTCNRLRH